jgi:hypothetical protein
MTVVCNIKVGLMCTLEFLKCGEFLNSLPELLIASEEAGITLHSGNRLLLSEISDSHGDEYEEARLLGYCIVECRRS